MKITEGKRRRRYWKKGEGGGNGLLSGKCTGKVRKDDITEAGGGETKDEAEGREGEILRRQQGRARGGKSGQSKKEREGGKKWMRGRRCTTR